MTRRAAHRRGMVLIATIVAIALVSVLGVTVMSLTTTSSYSRVVASQSNRAYYLAESGWAYALGRYNANGTVTTNGTYHLGSDGEFTLTGNSTSTSVTFTAVGIVDEGTGVEARRRLTYSFKKSESTSSLELSFTNAAGVFDTNKWNLDSDHMEAEWDQHEMALNMEGQGGGAQKVGAISLKWKPNNVFLSTWNMNGLLSYDIQVKMRNYQPGANANGISFRLNTTGPNGYGMSFCEPGEKIPSAFDGLSTTNAYVVLWKQTNGIMTRLAYSKLTAASGVLNGRYFKDYSTLLVSLREVYINGTNGQRQNLISAYVQSTNTYPRNTAVKWQTEAGSTFYQLTWDNGTKTITNSAYTSANFDTLQPAEIGLHAFCGNSSPKSFFDDFFIYPDGGGSGGAVQSPIVY